MSALFLTRVDYHSDSLLSRLPAKSGGGVGFSQRTSVDARHVGAQHEHVRLELGGDDDGQRVVVWGTIRGGG